MQNNDIYSSKINESLFDVDSTDVPNTDALQFRILQKTKMLTQQANNNQQIKQAGKAFSFLSIAEFFQPKLAASFTVAASVALIVVLLVPGLSQQSATEPGIAIVQNGFSVSDEIDFEEAMMLDDELIFAQL